MSPISLSLDLLLAVLLIAALGFGWRLERRLKGLRASHVDFTLAVADLDRAALRAEAGLAQLREATDEAVDLLAGRIEKARELAAKLDKSMLDAASADQRRQSEAPRSSLDKYRTRPPAAASDSSTAALIAAESLARRLAGDDVLELRTQAPPVAQAAVHPMRPSRPVIDDDLFESPRRAAPERLAQEGRPAWGETLRGRL